MRLNKILSAIPSIGVGLTCGLVGTSAFASSSTPWQKGFQPAVTTVMEDIVEFHDLLLVIITLTTIFVLVLLLYTMWRFSAKRNPIPSKTTHHATLEMVWTIVPVIILVVIAVPSFKLLYKADVVPKADMTVKAIGNQWYWQYEYPDHGKFGFAANMIPDATSSRSLAKTIILGILNGSLRPILKSLCLSTRLFGCRLRRTMFLHAWAMPAFGVKIDAVPGRLNQTWFNANKEGTYYGQCSELCGVNHGFMPIKVKVVSKAAFAAWVTEQRKAAGLLPMTIERRKVAKLNNSAR